jgi:hypothetical protein|tara:strand:+ start:696 stop:980 length:285 start_codon:yes stop_codon:yes gene_type:complete
MDLYQKVEQVIQNHILEHQEEVFKAKTLLSKLDVARCNAPEVTPKDWDEFWEDVSSDKKVVAADGYSVHYYDYTRNDPNRTNPFTIPDYTELPD